MPVTDRPELENANLRVAAQPFFFKVFKIIAPNLIFMATDVIKVLPAIDAGIVEIVELDANGIISDWL